MVLLRIYNLYNHKIYTTYIPLFSSRSGKVIKLEEGGFIFDEDSNEYTCSQGKSLLPRARNTNGTIYKSSSMDCADCIVSKDCLASLRKYSQHIRHIFRSHNQQFFETEQKRMQELIFQNSLKERMWKIEGINAEANNRHGLKRAKYRGLEKVQIQANMVGAVLNIKRIVAYFYALFTLVLAWKVMYYNHLASNTP